MNRPWHFKLLKLACAGLAGVAALELTACHPAAHRQAAHRPAAMAAAPPAPRPPPPPPPFTPQDTSAALETLKQAPDQGFPARRFHVAEIERLLGSAARADQADGRRRLRAAVLDYARAQHGLTIPQGALPRAWNTRPSKYDAATELDAALRAGTLAAWLDQLPPQSATYRALQAAYVAARRERPQRPPPKVQAGPLDLGEQDARTEALRRRLALEAPNLAAVDWDAPVDQNLIDALRAYQTRKGLDATGVLDAPTAEQLNTPVMSKRDRLRVNLERLRWLPRPEPADRIDVNIAASEMDLIRNGAVALHMLAVSGKPEDQTPMVSSAIDSIVLDPPWHVPNDIARKEILPKGAAYIRSHHFFWRGDHLIQRPGPRAALGLVKFDFPNPYAVYLHDTPAKSAFNLAQRTASHGCVRLQHAVQLARTLAADEPGLSPQRIDRILASGKTVRLKLEHPIPVRLMYLTAAPKDGAIAYLPDVYGWDAELLALLDQYQAPRRSDAPRREPAAPLD